jgi:hypothetical protein
MTKLEIRVSGVGMIAAASRNVDAQELERQGC